MMSTFLALALVAHPRPFPFTYIYPTMPEGGLELEQYVDIVPVRITEEKPDGTLEGPIRPRFALQTELELGITDKLELGFYLVANQSGEGSFVFDGLKQRLKYRLFEQGEMPLDIALYGEIAEKIDELELEEKIILSRRFGPVIVAANIWFEEEYAYGGEWELLYNPTAGVSFELIPEISLGLEGWVRGAAGDESFTHGFLGPVLLAQKGEYWLSLGGYVKLDGLGDTLLPGEAFGPVYVRVIAGIGLH